MKANGKNLERFSKQIILKKIGVSGQKKIFSSKILVIGAGGLGCPLIMYLANSGVGHIGIVDHDKIDKTNLNRQILFNPADVGKYKVYQAKKFVKKINKDIKVKVYKKKMTDFNIKRIINNFDIICDGTDNFETRRVINDACLKSKKILISAAISKYDGQVFTFNFKKKNPCYRCFMPEIPEYFMNCETEGVMSTVAGITGVIQANEVIKAILNIKNNLEGKMLIFNSLTLDFRKIKLSKNLNCIKECTKK